MDYYGLFPKFKFNRPLNDDEKVHHLRQAQHIELGEQSLVPDAKVISINSNYLELVDKYYSFKGLGSLIGAFAFICFSLFFLFVLVSTLTDEWITLSDIGFTFLVSCISIPAIIFTFKILRTEWFAWTHYPTRFDRKNRLVHVFRLDGSTYSVPWDKVFFTSGLSHRKEANKDYYISGHVLAEDNETVVDTFCLPATSSNRKELERHWEFVRRYMEDGPCAVIDVVNFCLPITKKREGYRFGLLYLLSGFNGAPIFFFPLLFALAFIFSIPRYMAMITSRIPVWPQNIENMCNVTTGDPYFLDATINSKSPWKDIFRKS